jgi:hypothetical protein
MNDDNMITIRNKRTGEVKTVPRSQFVEEEPSTGISGVGNDVMSSLQSAPDAFVNMLKSIPGGAKNVYNYAKSNNPLETLGNLGAGGVESAAGLLSSPKILARYLAEKFPRYGELLEKGRSMRGEGSLKEPTLRESLMNFEKNHGMGAQSPEEASVRNLGGLLFGGKGLSKLPNMGSRVAALAAQQGGEGGDPLHAAILGMLGEMTGRGIRKTPGAVLSAAKAVPEVTQNIPKHAANAGAFALQGTADALSSIPGVGKVIAPIVQPALGIAGAKLKYAATTPEQMAKDNLFGDITKEDLPEMQERDAALKRMGVSYGTPSELMNDAYESAKQADVGRTKKGMKELYKAGENREGTEEGAINGLFDMIHTDKLEPAKKAAYETSMAEKVPDEFIEKYKDKPVVEKAMKAIKTNSAYKQLLHDEYGKDWDKATPNSFMYWDMIKRVLDDFEQKSKRKGGGTEQSVYARVRRSMIGEMDEIQPEYKNARKIAERGFTRKKLESVFDKKDKTFNNFDSFLKSKENFDDIMDKLSDFPEAQQRLKDIKMFSGKMIPNNPTIRANAALKRTGMSDARNPVEAYRRKMEQKYGENHDVAAVKQMTHPDLMKHIRDYLEEKGKL